MSDYRCEHGGYAMGRDCSECRKQREEDRRLKNESIEFVRKWIQANSHDPLAAHIKRLAIV